VGGRAADVFVPLDDYEYVEPPAAVLDRFTAGFEARPGATEVVDSVAARTVVPRDGDASRGTVVVSVAIAEGVGPLAEGFQEGVLGSLSAEGTPEAVEISGRPATLVDAQGQQALYLQGGTTVLFFVGGSGRESLLLAANALVSAIF